MQNSTLFIDGQVFQSAAWDRGMGKYSLALIRALASHEEFSYKDVYIIFTKNLPLPPEVKKLIEEAAPNVKHIFADLRVPDDPCQVDIEKMQTTNQGLLDNALASYSKAVGGEFDYLILALFIDQVCSIFPSLGRKILLFYDLIPLQYSERYGKLCTFPNYLARFQTIFQAGVILTISQTVADDVALCLGISKEKICNIDGAPIERSGLKPKKLSKSPRGRFVLMPSGNDIRKNNMRAVQGFEAYRQGNEDKDIELVLTSTFDDGTKSNLEAHSNNLVFTGNVAEEELRWLYKNAEALLFVPEYEGLGLPILEAAEVNKPIVCSNLTVFNEISPSAFYYSDPFDPLNIADALNSAIGGEGLAEKIKEYPDILRRYTWANTAYKALRALHRPHKALPTTEKLRIAIFSPSPSGYSAIGKLVMQLHPSMEEYFDIDYYLETGKTKQDFTRPNYLPFISQVFPAKDFNKKIYKQYDAVLYHLGNSEFHVETIKNALYLPGYAVFHDTHLTNIFEGELLSHNYVTNDRLEAERQLDGKIGNSKASYISSLVNNQLGLIAHSSYTKESLLQSRIYKDIPALKVNLPTATPIQVPRRLNSNHLTIGLAGIIHPAKGLDVIESIAQSDLFYNCRIHIFGLSLVSAEVIKKLEAYPNVTVDTNVTDFQFQNMLSQVDVLINFRPEYRGETSLATIEAMRFGAIPIVKKVGWYDELPDETVVKAKDKAELLSKLEELTLDLVKQAKMKTAARRLIEKEFSYEAYAKSLYEFISAKPMDGKNYQLSVAIKKGLSLDSIKNKLQR